MKKKKTLKWRLNELPDTNEVRNLIKDEIITKEEGRDILFTEEIEEERSKKSLKKEIEFLKEVVDNLSKDRLNIITVVEKYIPPYKRYDFYQPYYQWTCGTSPLSAGYNSDTTITTVSGDLTTSASAELALLCSADASFKEIKT